MFDPFETEFIYSLIILVCFNNLIGRIEVVAIPILQIILAYHNDKQRYRPIIKIDTLDYNDLFPIARLYDFSFFTPVVQRYNKNGYNLIYKKTCLIEVPDIELYNIIFSNYILEKLKSSSNDLWIFVLGLLVIVQTIPMRTEFWLSFDEVRNPTRSDIYCIICCQQSVGYIFNIVYPKRKSS